MQEERTGQPIITHDLGRDQRRRQRLEGSINRAEQHKAMACGNDHQRAPASSTTDFNRTVQSNYNIICNNTVAVLQSAVTMWGSFSSIPNQPLRCDQQQYRTSHRCLQLLFQSKGMANHKQWPLEPANQKWALAAASDDISMVMVKVGACRSKRRHQQQQASSAVAITKPVTLPAIGGDDPPHGGGINCWSADHRLTTYDDTYDVAHG